MDWTTISPSQVRYRAALRPDLPYRQDFPSLLGFEKQGKNSMAGMKMEQRIWKSLDRNQMSHQIPTGCSKLVPPKETADAQYE